MLVREEPVLAAVIRFYADRVFGPDRAALLAAILPVTAAAQAARTTARAKVLRKKLAKIDVAETALISELETPAAQALRNRIRARFTELDAERSSINTDLAALEATARRTRRRPHPAGRAAHLRGHRVRRPARPALIERLLAVFDLRAVYNATNTSSPSAPPGLPLLSWRHRL